VGSTVAGRYHLLSILGTGGQGEVFTAQDQLSGELVALKWMNSAAARARREVSALRLLRLPGVVRFLDEGVDEGRPFLVMEQVSGTPFPGRAVPCTWDDISGVVLGWLETLARIHSAGVVHRDLKPANVLVDVSGRATVLDFGLSLHEAPSSSPLTQEREMLGTPAYLAPEQINGESATQRTDLYAVGVMLYEALSGHIPHEARDLRALLRARLLRRPAPLRSVAPEVPPGIAEVVARLLSVDAGERPVSATEVIGLLRGQPLVSRPSAWLGARAPVDALVAAARAGVSLHLSGGEGSGRSRCLREASEELAREGRRVEWIRPGKRALSAFAPWVEAFVQENPGADLARVEGELVAMLRAKLSAGVVLVVDDHHTLDRASARMVARCAAEGSWLTAGVGPGLALAPLSADDLGALFVGPDRLLHLREDGARLLWERTEGVPARVFAELEAWERSGLAHRDGERWSVRRGELERIELGPALRVEEAAPLLPVHSQ
jgi:serine/threonine-protein kinase